MADPSVPPEVAQAPPDQRYGKFVSVAKLGAGGMGEVWKAWDLGLNRWVALKFLRGGDEQEIARFTREAQVAGALTHPNIAAIYEVGQERGRRYIAMQYVDGGTLKGVDRREAARLVRDSARAVAYAHERGVVHRDIKPDNVMVSRGHAYVMDFGLARAIEGDSRLSLSGTVVGTPAYMSPEQSRGEKVDGRADVYSLGADRRLRPGGRAGEGRPRAVHEPRDREIQRRRPRGGAADYETALRVAPESWPNRKDVEGLLERVRRELKK